MKRYGVKRRKSEEIRIITFSYSYKNIYQVKKSRPQNDYDAWPNQEATNQ